MILCGGELGVGLFGLKVVQGFQNELILADYSLRNYEAHVKFVLDKALNYSFVIYITQSAGSS